LGKNQITFFVQDKRETHYGGGMETVRSHKRPAYVVIVTPTVGFFFVAILIAMTIVKNEIKIFNSPQFGEVRTIVVESEPWFIASDVCNILGLTNVTKAIKNLDDDERSNFWLGRQGNTNIISESGLYTLIIRSNKPEAKPFRKWVTSEVLPSIRKSGGYMTAKPEETPEEIMARALVLAQETISRQKDRADRAEKKALLLENQNEAQSEMLESVRAEKKRMLPKVTFATAVETSDRSILVGELAKVIKQNGVEIGQNRLFEWLRQNGFLCKSGESYNLPTQRALNMELFEIKKKVITKPNGDTLVSTTPKVTGKGQIYFVNRFLYDSINQAEIEKQKKGGAK
jgi:prophage antirepressor-like protein